MCLDQWKRHKSSTGGYLFLITTVNNISFSCNCSASMISVGCVWTSGRGITQVQEGILSATDMKSVKR